MQYSRVLTQTGDQHGGIIFNLPWNYVDFFVVTLMDIFLYIRFKPATFKYIWICHIYKKHKLQGQILPVFCAVPLSNLFKSKDLPSAEWFGKIQPQRMELKKYLSSLPTDEEKAAEKKTTLRTISWAPDKFWASSFLLWVRPMSSSIVSSSCSASSLDLPFSWE